jgi:hypothetical protein
MVKEIVTNSGHKLLVDDEDFALVSRFSIHIVKHKGRISSVLASIQLGRLLMNPERHLVVDHINENPLDNQKQNLRTVASGANMQNRHKLLRNGKPPASRYIGVTRTHRRLPVNSKRRNWICQWSENGRQGRKAIESEIDAALYYDMKVLETYGPVAKTNFLRTCDRPVPSLV